MRFVLICALPFILGADCKQVAIKTALDVAGCAIKSVADSAAQIVGPVSEVIFSEKADAAIQTELKDLGKAKGVAVVGCALDRLVHDLGGAVVEVVGGARPSTGHLIESAPRRAVRRALMVKAELSR